MTVWSDLILFPYQSVNLIMGYYGKLMLDQTALEQFKDVTEKT